MAGIETDKAAQAVIDAIAEKYKNLKTLNIIVAGKTGVGKSTLINAVFKEKLANTGVGKPVTTHMQKFYKEDIPLSIYDTRGFELRKEVQDEVKQEVLNTINDGFAKKDINEVIHCIWYCINTASNRIEPEEIEWLRELSMEDKVAQVPIIVILTQAFSQKNAQEMRHLLLEENLNVIEVIPVLAEDYVIEGVGTAAAYGLDVLIKVMVDILPDELQDTLQNVQIASLEEKKRRASEIVAKYAAATLAEGAIPIPLSDSVMMTGTQIFMIARITVVFGFDLTKGTIMGLLVVTLGPSAASYLGKNVFSYLLKLIPGVGTVVGGLMSGGTAAIITAALGEAYVGLLSLVFKGEMSINDLKTKKGKDAMANLFKDQLTLKSQEYSKRIGIAKEE